MNKQNKSNWGIIIVLVLICIPLLLLSFNVIGAFSNTERFNTLIHSDVGSSVETSDDGSTESPTDNDVVLYEDFDDKVMACLGDSITYGYVTKRGGQYENEFVEVFGSGPCIEY